MKNTVTVQSRNIIEFRPQNARTYPNAAENGYFLHRALDLLLAAATGLGAVSILMCLLILG